MAIKIKLKNSVTQNAVPTGTHLPEVGELAVNANINSIGGYMRASDNSIVKIFGPGSVSTPAASTTVSGIAELATSAETTTGTDTARVCTPAGVKAVTDAERTTSNSTYLALAGGTLTGVLQATAGSNSAPAIHFGDSDSGIYGGTNTVSLTAAGTQGLTLNSSGYVNVPTRLGVGVASPDVSFEVNGGADSIAKITGTTTAARLDLKTNSHHRFIQVLESDGGLRFYDQTSAGEMLRIDSSGRLLVGTSSARTFLTGYTPSLQVEGTGNSDSAFGIVENVNATSGPSLWLGKTRATSLGGATTVQDGDELGTIVFNGADGTDLECMAGWIRGKASGTIAGNRMPGSIEFATTADSAGSVVPTTALTLNSSQNATFAGKIGLGTGTNPIDALLHISSANIGAPQNVDSGLMIEGSSADLQFMSANTSYNHIFFGDPEDPNIGIIAYHHASNSNSMVFTTNTATALTLDSSQNAIFTGNVTAANTLSIVNLSNLGDAFLYVKAGEAGASVIELQADEADDNNDLWRIQNAGDSHLGFRSKTSGSWVEKLGITADGHVGIGVTPSAWPTNADSIALQIGTGFVAYGRGSGDQDRGGIAVNYYNDGTNQRYIANGHSNRIYMNDGNIDFQYAGENTSSAGAVLTFTSGMRMLADGKVGIGTTSPNSKLQVASGHINIDSGYSIQWGDTHERIEQSDSTLEFFTGNSEKMTLSGSNLGIGTVSPDEKLDIRDGDIILSSTNAGSAHRTSFIEFTGSYARINSVMGYGSTTASNYSAGWNITTRDWNGSAFSTLTPLSIQANGNTGLSETSPARKLHVTGGAHFGFAGTNGGAPYIGTTPALSVSTEGNSGGADIFADNALVHFGRGGGGPGAAGVTTTLFRVDLGGRVGIQGAPTKAILDVRASGGSNTYLTAVFGANEGTVTGALTDAADKGARLGFHHYDNDEEAYAFVSCGGTSTANAINFGGGTSLMNAATDLGFYTAANNTTTTGLKRAKILSDGTFYHYHNGSDIKVALGGTGQINGIAGLPSSAGTPLAVARDTGTARSAHFGGHLKFTDGYGLDFGASESSHSSDSSILADYEKGRWTSTVSWSDSISTTGTVTATSSLTGYFIKIDKLVWISLEVTPSTHNGGDTCIIISCTLPFTPDVGGSPMTLRTYSGTVVYGSEMSGPFNFYGNVSTGGLMHATGAELKGGSGFWGHKTGTTNANGTFTGCYRTA